MAAVTFSFKIKGQEALQSTGCTDFFHWFLDLDNTHVHKKCNKIKRTQMAINSELKSDGDLDTEAFWPGKNWRQKCICDVG